VGFEFLVRIAELFTIAKKIPQNMRERRSEGDIISSHGQREKGALAQAAGDCERGADLGDTVFGKI
jgi:hypothetical protein